MKKRAIGIVLEIAAGALLLLGCGGSPASEAPPDTLGEKPTVSALEEAPQKPEIEVLENREGELVFSISMEDFIAGFNERYPMDAQRSFLSPPDTWQKSTYDCSVHAPYETVLYSFSEDETVWSLPRITVYVPSNADYIQQITVNYDEHSHTETGYALYRQMCCCALEVFFPELSEDAVQELCAEVLRLGSQNTFDAEAWYGPGAVPCALFYRGGVGVYPYFAVGDWNRLCIIPLTEERIAEFEGKGVEIHEIG